MFLKKFFLNSRAGTTPPTLDIIFTLRLEEGRRSPESVLFDRLSQVNCSLYQPS